MQKVVGLEDPNDFDLNAGNVKKVERSTVEIKKDKMLNPKMYID